MRAILTCLNDSRYLLRELYIGVNNSCLTCHRQQAYHWYLLSGLLLFLLIALQWMYFKSSTSILCTCILLYKRPHDPHIVIDFVAATDNR